MTVFSCRRERRQRWGWHRFGSPGGAQLWYNRGMSLNFRYRCPKGMHSKEAFCWHASLMLLPAEERFHDLPRLEGNGAAAEAG